MVDPEETNHPGSASAAARVAVGLALFGCWVTVFGPLSAIFAVLAAGALVAGAAFVQLHTGGFAPGPFGVCVWLGVLCAVVLILRAWAASGPKAGEEAGAGEAPARPTFKRSVASLLGGSSLVTFAEWDGNAWLPDPLSSFLVLSCLIVLLAAVPLALLWGGVRVVLGLYRWARGSGFVAGLITALAALLAAGSLATCNAEGPPPRWEDTVRARTVRQVIRVAVEAEGFTATMRALLMATAEAIDPQAFRAYTAKETRALRPPTPPAPPAPTQPTVPASPPDPEVTACFAKIVDLQDTGIEALFERLVARVRGAHPLLAEDELKELVLDTMLEVCLAEDRAEFRSVEAVFYKKLDERAIDRSRRARKSCELLPVYESCQLETVDTLRGPELGALHDLLCGLRAEERAILVLRVVMGMGFREVGEPLGLTADKAREVFNNTRRRLKRDLEARCMSSP